MLRKNIPLLFLILSSFWGSISNAQNSQPKIVVDTSTFSVSIDSLKINLLKDVQDKVFWLDILRQDTLLISCLRAQFKFEIQTISIINIERITSSSYSYQAEIYCREKNKPIYIQNDSLPIPSIKRRSCYYKVKLKSVNGTLKTVIDSIKLNYCGM